MGLFRQRLARPPAALAPAAACRARSSMCTLHGVTWLHVEQTPICGFAKSSRVKPTACSIARPGARAGPSSTFEECGRRVIIERDYGCIDDAELAVGSRVRGFAFGGCREFTGRRLAPPPAGREPREPQPAGGRRTREPANLH